MKADVLIADLHARGVERIADGELLRCRPKSALTPEVLDELRARKPEVLACLRTGADSGEANLICYACRESRFWHSIHGQVVCAVCHPPADPRLVAERNHTNASPAASCTHATDGAAT